MLKTKKKTTVVSFTDVAQDLVSSMRQLRHLALNQLLLDVEEVFGLLTAAATHCTESLLSLELLNCTKVWRYFHSVFVCLSLSLSLSLPLSVCLSVSVSLFLSTLSPPLAPPLPPSLSLRTLSTVFPLFPTPSLTPLSLPWSCCRWRRCVAC